MPKIDKKWLAAGAVAFVALAAIGSQVEPEERVIAGPSVESSTTTAPATEPSDSNSDDNPVAPAAPTTAVTITTTTEKLEEIDDFVSCVKVNQYFMEVELTNRSPKTSSYQLDFSQFDDSGERVGQFPAFVSYVHPGERVVEWIFAPDVALGNTKWSSCKLSSLNRAASGESEKGEQEEVTCEIIGSSDRNELVYRLTATNGTPKNSDYDVYTAFIDVDGVRRGSALDEVAVVEPGETATLQQVVSDIQYRPDLVCDIRHVDRSAS